MEEFETIQGYLDFVELRKKLAEKWPGCKTPSLLPVNQYV